VKACCVVHTYIECRTCILSLIVGLDLVRRIDLFFVLDSNTDLLNTITPNYKIYSMHVHT